MSKSKESRKKEEEELEEQSEGQLRNEFYGFDEEKYDYDSYDDVVQLDDFVGNNYDHIEWLSYMVRHLLERIDKIEKGNISFNGVGSSTSYDDTFSDYEPISYYEPNIKELDDEELKPIKWSGVDGLNKSYKVDSMDIEDYS